MTKGVGSDAFREPGPAHSLVECALNMRLVQMISPQFLCRGNLRQCLPRKKPLPYKIFSCRGIFLLKPVIEKDPGISRPEIFIMDLLHQLNLGSQFWYNRLRQGNRAVLFPFPMDREDSDLELKSLT